MTSFRVQFEKVGRGLLREAKRRMKTIVHLRCSTYKEEKINEFIFSRFCYLLGTSKRGEQNLGMLVVLSVTYMKLAKVE